MTRAANLVWGVFVTAIAYALAFVAFVHTLSPAGFPTLIASVLAAPTFVAGAIAFRKNPEGRWWVVSMIAVGVTAALMLATIFAILSGSHDL